MTDKTTPSMPQPWLENETLLLRPVKAEDAEALYQAASHPDIWAQHPNRYRYQRAVFTPYFNFLVSHGALVFIDKTQNRLFGCSRFYRTPHTGVLSIGFTFIHIDYWGTGMNGQIKSLMLTHGFQSDAEIWFHVDPNNIRSQKAVEKLGAILTAKERLDLGTGQADFYSYQLTRANWEKKSDLG